MHGKPATALNILRETVMGEELFDFAFKTYSRRWMFKHPTPEDFFRTMEDASAVDLLFWRGWFYTTDYVDIGVEKIRELKFSDSAPEDYLKNLSDRGIEMSDVPPLISAVQDDNENFNEIQPFELSPNLKNYLEENFTKKELSKFSSTNYFYEISFNACGA